MISKKLTNYLRISIGNIALILLFQFVAIINGHAETKQNLLIGDKYVGISSESSGSMKFVICKNGAIECTTGETNSGISVVPMNVSNGDILKLTLIKGKTETSSIHMYKSKENVDWIERIALVVVGAFVGLFGNVLKDKLKTNSDEKKLYREWRDNSIDEIQIAKDKDAVWSYAAIPKGLPDKLRMKIEKKRSELTAIRNQFSLLGNRSITQREEKFSEAIKTLMS